MATRTTIFATPTTDGKWTLTDAEGQEAQEGYKYTSKQAALDAARQLWPTNSVWQGKAVRNGWSIVID